MQNLQGPISSTLILQSYIFLQLPDTPLVAGLTNLVSLTITTGPAAILNQSMLELTLESGLMFQAMERDLPVITSQSDEEYTNAEYHIELADGADEQNSKMSSRWWKNILQL